MTLRFPQTVVLLSGAAQGIGAATALRFAREGARLALLDLKPEALQTLAAQCEALGAEVLTHAGSVAERSTFYALPEGTRGIFVGGGGSVRISRLLGVARMTDLMLTGRVLDAEEGHALALATYLVDEGQGLARATALAEKIASNAPLSNYAITQALPRIAELAPAEGLFMESLISSIAQGDEAAKERVRAFLAGKAAKVARS